MKGRPLGRYTQAIRVICILRRLEDATVGEWTSLSALATEHGVDMRTIRRDVEVLEMARVPIVRMNSQIRLATYSEQEKAQ